MSYITINKNDNDTYSIGFSDKFYDVAFDFYNGGSYYNILYRLFGLLPKDFYHYVGAQYNAQYRPSPILHHHIYMEFKTKSDAINFANEVDRRLTYLFK